MTSNKADNGKNVDSQHSPYEAALRYYREKAIDGDASSKSKLRELLLQKKGFLVYGGTLVKYVGKGGQVTVPKGITAIGSKAFEKVKVDRLVLPKDVQSLAEDAFKNNAFPEIITESPQILAMLEARKRRAKAQENRRKRERAKETAADAAKKLGSLSPTLIVVAAFLAVLVLAARSVLTGDNPIRYGCAMFGYATLVGAVTVAIFGLIEEKLSSKSFWVNAVVAILTCVNFLCAGVFPTVLQLIVYIALALTVLITLAVGVPEWDVHKLAPAFTAFFTAVVAFSTLFSGRSLDLITFTFPNAFLIILYAAAAIASGITCAVCAYKCAHYSYERDCSKGVAILLPISVLSLFAVFLGGAMPVYAHVIFIAVAVIGYISALVLSQLVDFDDAKKYLIGIGVGAIAVGIVILAVWFCISKASLPSFFVSMFAVMVFAGAVTVAVYGYKDDDFDSPYFWVNAITAFLTLIAFIFAGALPLALQIVIFGILALAVLISLPVGVNNYDIDESAPAVVLAEAGVIMLISFIIGGITGNLSFSFQTALPTFLFTVASLTSVITCIVLAYKCTDSDEECSIGLSILLPVSVLLVLGFFFGGMLAGVVNVILLIASVVAFVVALAASQIIDGDVLTGLIGVIIGIAIVSGIIAAIVYFINRPSDPQGPSDVIETVKPIIANKPFMHVLLSVLVFSGAVTTAIYGLVEDQFESAYFWVNAVVAVLTVIAFFFAADLTLVWQFIVFGILEAIVLISMVVGCFNYDIDESSGMVVSIVSLAALAAAFFICWKVGVISFSFPTTLFIVSYSICAFIAGAGSIGCGYEMMGCEDEYVIGSAILIPVTVMLFFGIFFAGAIPMFLNWIVFGIAALFAVGVVAGAKS